MSERMDQIVQNEKSKNPDFFKEPVTIFMGNDIISVIAEDYLTEDSIGVKSLFNVRSMLSTQEIVLPTVRLRDLMELNPREFIIVSYDIVLYQEDIPEEKEISSVYLSEKLEETFRLKYVEYLKICADKTEVTAP